MNITILKVVPLIHNAHHTIRSQC